MINSDNVMVGAEEYSFKNEVNLGRVKVREV